MINNGNNRREINWHIKAHVSMALIPGSFEV
jgi:hypothetical protein